MNNESTPRSDTSTQTKKLFILGVIYFLEQRLSAFRIRLNFEKIINNRFDEEVPECISKILEDDFSQANFIALEHQLNLIFGIHENIIELFTPYLKRPIEELSNAYKAVIITGFYALLNSGKTPYKIVGNDHLELSSFIVPENHRNFIKGVLIAFTKHLSPRPLSRRFAMQGVYEHLLNIGEEAKDIDTHIESFNDLLFEKADKDYYRRLMYGAINKKHELIQRFSNYLERPIDETTRIEVCILILGSHELINFPDVPYKVVINEYVELAKGFCGLDGYKFVNSVLDKVAHEIHG